MDITGRYAGRFLSIPILTQCSCTFCLPCSRYGGPFSSSRKECFATCEWNLGNNGLITNGLLLDRQFDAIKSQYAPRRLCGDTRDCHYKQSYSIPQLLQSPKNFITLTTGTCFLIYNYNLITWTGRIFSIILHWLSGHGGCGY